MSITPPVRMVIDEPLLIEKPLAGEP